MMGIEESIDFLDKTHDLPSIKSLSVILQRCRERKESLYAKNVYAHMCKYGLDDQKALGNYIVPMFVDCGNVLDAWRIFPKLPDRNEFSWTSLLHAFIDSGEENHAFNLYEQMKEENITPSKFTFPTLINACAVTPLEHKHSGLSIHTDIIKEGYEGDLFICNALVDMYAKWGALIEAQEVLDEMLVRDQVSWTSLMTGYMDNGFVDEALVSLEHMKLEGASPDEITYASCVRACNSVGYIEQGQSLHVEITIKGLEKDIFIGNTLVDMYASNGLLVDAQVLFDELPVQTVIAWTSLIDGYVEHGYQDKALNCFEKMRSRGVNADSITYVCGLKACSDLSSLGIGQELHKDACIEGFDRDLFISSTLVDMYAKSGLMADARDVFDDLSVQDVVSWTALISGYVEHGFNLEALKTFKEMRMEEVNPNLITYICCLKACSNLQSLDEGLIIHAEVVKEGIEVDLFIGNTLVDLYAKCGSFIEAQDVFDELPFQDIVSLNALISGFAEQGFGKEALLVYMQMQEKGISPDIATFASILKAYGNMQALDIGKKVHSQICSSRCIDNTDVIISIALLDMYGKCGSMFESQLVFDELPRRELMHWTALITGYTRQGESEYVSYLLTKMQEDGIKPNEVTFLNILTTCAHSGLVDVGLEYFESMRKDHGIMPGVKHCNCMVDLFCRVGRIHEAVEMLFMMPSEEPDLPAWSTVLGACLKWSNIDLGQWVFESALKTFGKNASLFTLMSNIYANGEMWEDKRKFEEMKQVILTTSTNEKTLRTKVHV